MNIPDAEKLFGKELKQWTKEEQRQFVEKLDGTEPFFPAYLVLAIQHREHVPEAYRKAIGVQLPKAGWG